MDIKRWNTTQKIRACAIFIGFYAFLKLDGTGAIVKFLLVGAIPGTRYSLPSGAMLMFYGLVIWLLFCQRTAAHYFRHYTEKQTTTNLTRLPRRRYSELS